MGAEGGFDGRLGEDHGGGVTLGVGLGGHGDAADELAFDAEVVGCGEGGDVREDFVGNAQVLEEAKDLVVDGDGARLFVNGGSAFHGKHFKAGLAQKAGEDGAGGAETDDGDVVSFGGG